MRLLVIGFYHVEVWCEKTTMNDMLNITWEVLVNCIVLFAKNPPQWGHRLFNKAISAKNTTYYQKPPPSLHSSPPFPLRRYSNTMPSFAIFASSITYLAWPGYSTSQPALACPLE